MVLPRVETMLMDVRLDDRVGLDVDKVPPSVRFNSQRQVHVRIDVPEHLPESVAASVFIAEGGVACPLDVWAILGKLGGYVAVEEHMGGGFLASLWIGGWRELGEFGGGEAANGLVRHDLHPCYGLGVIEVEQGARCCGNAEGFKFKGCNRYEISAKVPPSSSLSVIIVKERETGSIRDMSKSDECWPKETKKEEKDCQGCKARLDNRAQIKQKTIKCSSADSTYLSASADFFHRLSPEPGCIPPERW